MKIEKAKKEFTPVTLTFETQAELDFFAEVFYRVGGSKVKEVFGEEETVYNLLADMGGYVNDECPKTTGSIHVN